MSVVWPQSDSVEQAEGLCDVTWIHLTDGHRDWEELCVGGGSYINYALAFALQLEKLTENLCQKAEKF